MRAGTRTPRALHRRELKAKQKPGAAVQGDSEEKPAPRILRGHNYAHTREAYLASSKPVPGSGERRPIKPDASGPGFAMIEIKGR